MPSVLASKQRRKPRRSKPIDPHAFESVGSILRRMRIEAEGQMTTAFSPSLSLELDFLLEEQRRIDEGDET